LLNIPVRGDGSIDDREIEVLEGIAKWMDINKESIFGTKHWKVFGEGPTVESANPIKEQGFNEGKTKYSALDIRFNQKGNTIYATIMGVPTDDIQIKMLGSKNEKAKIRKIEVLGSKEKLSWTQSIDKLEINKLKTIPNEIAVVLKITTSK
jgi:alpha-L-fucosidase